MIAEKPMWLRHAGLQIFSIDIHADGLRFATAGGDHKVRIWNTESVAERASDPEAAVHKLLATLRDHFGSVNCVRWAKCGGLIASGADDQIILVHERRPGSGTAEFGSGELPDVENWKVLLTLRGHTADVVDLGWSPDDSLLASCSLDNTVRVWQAANGSPVVVLTGHCSLVKGLAWDPIGSFLATQSDDKTVIVWRTSTWEMVQKCEGPWGKSVGSTFFRRLGWSPCGHFIATTHGFQNPKHTAPVLVRGDWASGFDFVGHNAPIVAVRFNHSMFRKQVPPSAPEGGVGDIAGNGAVVANGASSKSSDGLPYNVIAIGSQDCHVSVWSTARPRPIFIGKHFFTQSVADLSWSPDGYTLFCCSLDGSVASFQFEPKELGQKISDREMEEFKKSRYGDVRVRQVTLAESPAQLVLEATAAKRWGTANPNKVTEPVGEAQGSSARKLPATEAGDRSSTLVTNVPVKTSPVKQTEYRHPDGRRRIIPEPLGLPSHEDRLVNGTVQNVRTEVLNGSPPGSRKDVDIRKEDSGRGIVQDFQAEKKRRLPEECTKVDLPPAKRSTGVDQPCGPTAHSGTPEVVTMGLGINGLAGSALQNASQVDMVTPAERTRTPDGVLSIRIQAPETDEAGPSGEAPVSLEARPVQTSNTDGPAGPMLMRESSAKAEIVCSQGGEVRWHDHLAAVPTVLAGNSNFWAVACADGSLQIYTRAGRRAQPSMMLGSAAAFMDCDQGWRLLLVTCGGSLHLWDLRESNCILQESLGPLLSSSSANTSLRNNNTIKVVSARLSQAGAPLVVLANQHAFLFHLSMRCWLRVADDAFPASNFLTTWPEQEGELTSLQAGVARAAGGSFIWSRASLGEERWQTRVHLEVKMGAALALKSPSEYRRCLLAYTRCLAREADEARLRELCEELLGPVYFSSVLDGPSTDNQQQWQPCILGMNKRELLKMEVLPAMASNRGVQRLLNEFADLLSECEARQQTSIQH